MPEYYTTMLWTLLVGAVSALATGFGAFPVHFISKNGETADHVKALASSIAAGMMISASVFSLAQEGMDFRSEYWYAPYAVIFGLGAGALFFLLTEKYLDKYEIEEKLHHIGRTRKSLLLFLTMFVHSIPEGVAIGVGFATGHYDFGFLIALAITVHNIPEGIAVSLPLKAEGASTSRCFWVSVLTSLPQPVMAVPAFILASVFKPALPFGLGFAGGAMIYIVFSELVPESLQWGGKKLTAMGIMIGLTGMLLITTLIENFTRNIGG